MKITIPAALNIIKDNIPEKILDNINSKYLIQYLDDTGVLVAALYRTLDEYLLKHIPDDSPILYSDSGNIKIFDSKRYRHIIHNMIYAIDKDRIKTALSFNSINIQRSTVPNNISHEDPKTFDYWGIQFDVVISLKPTRIKELLKPDGILLKI